MLRQMADNKKKTSSPAKKTGKQQRKTQSKKTAGTAAQKKRKRSSKKKKNTAALIILSLSVLCSLLFTLNIMLIFRFRAENQASSMPATSEIPTAQPFSKTEKQPVTPPSPKKPEKPENAGTLIFVFDDAGHNLNQLEHFLQLPFACTIAVLPQLPYSLQAAESSRKAGKEVILHQPMQSVNPAIDPGPGAITPDLSAAEIRAITRKNIEELWPLAGMNNHEGSLMTADKDAMRAVLDVVQEKKIFFLDSRTTPKTVVPQVAKEKNMKIWQRAVFIDNKKTRTAMKSEIEKGLGIARKKGYAILIGHVGTTELAQLLQELYPLFVQEGFTLSTISKIKHKGL